MNARIALVGLVLVALPATLPAQEGAPEEPELVLPTFILSVEDVPAEKIEAGIPEEADLLPPERTAPLPQSDELEIREPGITLAPPTGEETGVALGGSSFFVEGQVGAGTLHQLVSELSIYRPGETPGFKLAARYDMKDGLGGAEAGAGFHRKTAGLEGNLEFQSDSLDLTFAGSFEDRDVGLQSASPYGSRVLRRTHLQGNAAYTVSPVLSAGASLEAGATTLLLTSDTDEPAVTTGYVLRPVLSGGVRLGPFRGTLELRYGLTVDSGEPAVSTHRLEPLVRLGVDLPLHLVATADVGWHWAVGGPHLVPFRIEVTGTPVDPLWLSLAGGYRVTDQDRADAVANLPWSLVPATTPGDERGWFGQASVRVTVVEGLILSGGVDVWSGHDMLTLADSPEPSGLYAVVSADMTRLGISTGILWDIASGISTRLEYRAQLLDRRSFEPTHSVLLSGTASLARGLLGLDLSVAFDLVPELGLQLPVLNAGASVRLSSNVRAVAELQDLLEPLAPGPRAGIPPYVEPGFGGTVRLLVSL